MLGSVEEAETKRIDGRTYLANLHARRFEAPACVDKLNQNQESRGRLKSGHIPVLLHREEPDRRILPIAARPPAQRTELIATLFGDGQFNEFVGHFNESIDQQLVLTATKQLTLTGKRNATATDQAMVNGEATALLGLENEEAALACTHSAGMMYAGTQGTYRHRRSARSPAAARRYPQRRATRGHRPFA